MSCIRINFNTIGKKEAKNLNFYLKKYITYVVFQTNSQEKKRTITGTFNQEINSERTRNERINKSFRNITNNQNSLAIFFYYNHFGWR